MRTIFLLLITALTFTSFAQSDSKWSLQECIDYALEKNIQLQQGNLQGEIVSNNLKSAKFSRLPSLNASGNHNYIFGRTIDPFTNTFSNQSIQSNSFSISAGVLLYGGNQMNNTIKQVELSNQSNKENIEVIKNQISISASLAYLLILQGEENLKVAIAQQELTEQQLARAVKLVESGAANQSTTLNLQAQLANDELQVVNAQNSIQISYNNLMNLLQIDNTTNFEVEIISITSLPDMPTETVSEIYEIALSDMPEIKQAKLNVQGNVLGEKIASAALQPSLSAYGNLNSVYSESGVESILQGYEIVPIGITETSNEVVLGTFADYDFQTKSFGKQLGDNLGQSVGVSLSVPIFNGLRNKTNVENAKLTTDISELSLAAAENQLRTDITTAYTNLLSVKASLDAAQKNEEAQKKNFDFSQARFDAGMLNSVDLLNAKNSWNQAQINLVNNKYEYVFRNLIIEFYKGKPVSL